MPIRRCVPGDFEDVLPLLLQLWPHMRPQAAEMENTFYAMLQEDTNIVLCAEQNGGLCGFAAAATYAQNLYYNGGVCILTALVVEEKCRGTGVGRRLLREVEQVAKQMEMKAIEFDSLLERKNAHAFYKSMGYEINACYFSKKL